VQDAAYGTLLRSRRQQLHARIAATLEDQFRETVAAQPALVAWHCAEAGLAEKAVGYWRKAGQQARARSAITERSGLKRILGPILADWRPTLSRGPSRHGRCRGSALRCLVLSVRASQ
jgi:hypothetical protein